MIAIFVIVPTLVWLTCVGYVFGAVRAWETESCPLPRRNLLYYGSAHEYHNHVGVAIFAAMLFPFSTAAYFASRHGAARALMAHPVARRRRIAELEKENEEALAHLEELQRRR